MAMECDTRWRVAFASDLARRTVTFDAGEVFLRQDIQRLVLLNSRGHTVDARYVHEGERIDVGCIVSFPCHFAKIWDRLPVVGTSRGQTPMVNDGEGPWVKPDTTAAVHIALVQVHAPLDLQVQREGTGGLYSGSGSEVVVLWQ